MLGNKVLSKRLFSAVNNRVVIMANSNSSDSQASRFMNALNKVAGDTDIDYFGYGGDRMLDAGLNESFYDINNFNDKTFYTWRKTKEVTENHSAMRWTSWNLVNLHYRRNADYILDDLKDKKFVQSSYRHRPSAIISFDNEYFSIEMMKRINKMYYNNSVPLPARHYYNRFIKDFRQHHERYFDYMHFTIPKRTATPGGYFFPGQFVGQHGVYDALKHLMSSDPEQKHLVGDGTISISKKYFSGDIESSIQKIKATFRNKHKIDEDATVIFFSPGNEKNEATFSLDSARRGIEEFLLKFSSPTSLSPIAKPLDKFHTIISLEEGSKAESYVRAQIDEHGWKGDYTIVTNHKNEHFDGMAASDLGIMYDGQLVGSAAACHLPCMTLLEMRMHHQWYHDMFNRWWNSMATIADKDIYPELIGGQAWFGKICDTLGEWYLKPETRYDLVREWEYWLKDAMHKVDGPTPGSIKGENQIIINDGKSYEVFADGFDLMANNVWEQIQGYQSSVGVREVSNNARQLHREVANFY
jgi:lipid A disaccharide synthetase